MSQNQKYGIKRFIAIANEYVNPDTSTLEGIQKSLIGWFCEKYNTVPWDSRLQEATLDDLMVLYFTHKIKEDPTILEELDPNFKSYEDWLREEMGEDYVSDEEMSEQMVKYEEDEQEVASKMNLPEKITTDFSDIMGKKDD